MGRPSKLTPELQEKICGYIAEGNTIENSCAAVGISSGCYRQWMIKGREQKSGKYFTFLTAVKKAEAKAQARYVKIIHDASETTWTAAAWWLERKYPAQWGRKQRHEISGGDKPIEIEATISFEQIKSLEAARSKIIGDVSLKDSNNVPRIPSGNGGKTLDVENFIHYHDKET